MFSTRTDSESASESAADSLVVDGAAEVDDDPAAGATGPAGDDCEPCEVAHPVSTSPAASSATSLSVAVMAVTTGDAV
jgi:hypothetical protein